jgi:arsenate reductase
MVTNATVDSAIQAMPRRLLDNPAAYVESLVFKGQHARYWKPHDAQRPRARHELIDPPAVAGHATRDGITEREPEGMSVTIYHNPRCSKSRQTLQLLKDKGVEPEVIEYLNTPPDEATLGEYLTRLGMEPRELMRKKEAPYKELNLADENLDRAALIAAMVENPILIERPIVVSGGKVALGRPPESVLEIL